VCNEDRDCKCVGDILKVINILQRRAAVQEEGSDTCDKTTLGPDPAPDYNTRPIQLFLGDNNGNDPLKMPITKGPITPSTVFSSIFRVEKVDECCCTCRVLKPECDDLASNNEEELELVATDSFVTIDLRYVSMIRCLKDTYVECM
jgi:hypothetical protein